MSGSHVSRQNLVASHVGKKINSIVTLWFVKTKSFWEHLANVCVLHCSRVARFLVTSFTPFLFFFAMFTNNPSLHIFSVASLGTMIQLYFYLKRLLLSDFMDGEKTDMACIKLSLLKGSTTSISAVVFYFPAFSFQNYLFFGYVYKILDPFYRRVPCCFY